MTIWEFMHLHPWQTFFLGIFVLLLLGGVVDFLLASQRIWAKRRKLPSEEDNG